MTSVTADDMREAEEKYRSDPLLWRQYIFAEAAHRDYLLTLKAEREEGREEAENEIACNLREQGILTDEQIAQVVNLPAAPSEPIDPLDDVITLDKRRDNIVKKIRGLEVLSQSSLGLMKQYYESELVSKRYVLDLVEHKLFGLKDAQEETASKLRSQELLTDEQIAQAVDVHLYVEKKYSYDDEE